MRALLVEDSLDLAANAGEFLKSRGHDVDYAHSGHNGLRLAGDTLSGFDAGADDYLTKPFSLLELGDLTFDGDAHFFLELLMRASAGIVTRDRMERIV